MEKYSLCYVSQQGRRGKKEESKTGRERERDREKETGLVHALERMKC